MLGAPASVVTATTSTCTVPASSPTGPTSTSEYAIGISTGVSSSVTVTVTSAALRSSRSTSSELSVWVRMTGGSSAWSSSCSAVTVTVCGTFQSRAVKVRVVLSRVRSAPVTPSMVTVTSPAGCVSSTTS